MKPKLNSKTNSIKYQRSKSHYTYLAEFYQETNQNDKAMDTYKEILKVDPKIQWFIWH